MSQISVDDEISIEFLKVLDKYFPKSFFRSNGSSGLVFNAVMSENNRDFQGSPYYYDGDLSFIHWTSISNLMSILNSREIRFYNLFSSKDKNEFSFSASTIGLTQDQIKNYKEHYHIFSFCKKTDLSNKFLWGKYGDKFKGLAIEFTILNDPKDWVDYNISRVYYRQPKKFEQLADDLNTLKENFPGVTFDLDLGKLIGFHKENRFRKENEVRLSVFFPYKTVEECWKYYKTEFRIEEGNNRKTSYFNLPLWINNDSVYVKNDNPYLDRRTKFDEDYFTTRPKIKINNIYFGHKCGISHFDFPDFQKDLYGIFKQNFGYEINLAQNLFEIKSPQ